MKAILIRLWVALSTTALLCVLLMGGLAAQGQPKSETSAPSVPIAWTQAGESAPRIVINEVMPKAGADGYEWIELRNTATQPRLFLPMILRGGGGALAADIAVEPAPGNGPLAVEGSFNIGGWSLRGGAGEIYRIGAELGLVPPNAFVLIIFDGLGAGANDYDFSDGRAVLHSEPRVAGERSAAADVLGDAEGFVGLYHNSTPSPSTIEDYVSWGAVFAQEADAVNAGLWPPGAYLEFAPNAGYVDPALADLRTAPDESVGRTPQDEDEWAIYRADQLTPGAANPIPKPGFAMPLPGDTLDVRNGVIGWSAINGATMYDIQIARDAQGADVALQGETPYPDFHLAGKVTAGDYFWSVRTHTGKGIGPWSAWTAFTVANLNPGLGAAETDVQKTLGIVWQVQHKDTPSLDVSDANFKTGDGAWDVVHPATHRVSEHDNHYCQVAGMAMINSYYGGNISQDRLSYYAIREYPDSKRGLDPNRTCTFPADCRPGLEWDFWAGHNKGLEGLSWSLGYAWDDWSQIDRYSYNPPTTTLSFNSIRTWIDGGRPMIVTIPGHIMVIDGYRTTPSNQVHLLDPWTAASWVLYTDNAIQRINWVGVYKAKGVAGAPPAPRSDEASIWTDSDGDGVTDFDEMRRFHTDPFDKDTDNDWIWDKQDILDTVYRKDGTHVWSPARQDIDNDGDPKWLDWDNDNDGSPDGCEDVNIDGEYDLGAGETDNFSAGSKQDCVPRLDILYPLKTNKANVGDPADPDKLIIQVETKVPDGWSLYLPPNNFDVKIGGLNAPVLAAYQSADTHFLVVSPPVQSAAAFYDLDVKVASQSDAESQAVYYLPKSPNDAVMVLDRSGSMTSDNKMAAAKNAGAAFVDMLNDDDYVGVASFATTATSDYALTKITGDPVRNAAITAINGLVADGWTALGQGAQKGHQLLTAAGQTDHDWTMVLLSDGYENEAPNWSAIASSVTNVTVHTVALGDDANATLLQSIAGSKGGAYFFVDTDPPTPAPRSAQDLLQGEATPPLAVPPTLGNRLADVYVAAGELSQGWQRIFETTGNIPERQPVKLTVPMGFPQNQVVFTLNWEDAQDYLALELLDPAGTMVKPNQELRASTHHQIRVNNPARGDWTVYIHPETGGVDYHLMVSGRTETTVHASVGGDAASRGVGMAVPLNAMVTDYREILGVKVVALVQGPGIGATVQLFDDGAHGDGQADDGWYAAEFTGADNPGGYAVKVVAWGVNNHGEEFVRYAQTGFNVRYRAAYIWWDNSDLAADFEALLEGSDWLVDRIHVGMVPDTDLRPYSLLVVGPDTGSGYDWVSPDIAGYMNQFGKPILGLGDGGAALFEQYDLSIGYGQTWRSNNNEVRAVDPSSGFWHTPYEVGLGPEVPLALLYFKPLKELGVYIPSPNRLLIPIAREPNDQNHYPVAMQIAKSTSYVLWGYNLGPNDMTPQGQRHFLDVAHYLR